MNRLTRGKLARQSGVNIATIRYYEKLELLPEPPRSNAGYRVFSPESVKRIRFIKHAQELGFSLKEIKELLDLRVTPDATTTDVRARATKNIANIGERIRRLSAIKQSLELLVKSCCSDSSVSECPILESLILEENQGKFIGDNMSEKRKVEVFSAGCAVCDETVNLVNQIACGSCDVEVLDTREPGVAKRAREYGIKAVPSIVIDGKLADCCANQEIGEDALRAAGIGVPLS